VVVIPFDKAAETMLSHPTPGYPAKARARHLSGTGVYELQVEETGEVSSVTVISSTGYPILDSAAIKTLKQWRFRPHTTLVRVKVPITFSMPGKSSESKEKT
jgi:protein TonB